jgi:hypothetical protein
MKAILLACVSIFVTGCWRTEPPDPAELEYKVGDIYRVKRPLFVEEDYGHILISKPTLMFMEARKNEGQPGNYLKNPKHESYRDIRGVVVPGSRLRVSRIRPHYYGRGYSDWEVYAQLLQPRFEGREISLYVVSGDYDRVGHYSNGCADSQLLELVSHAKSEPEQAAPSNGDKPSN